MTAPAGRFERVQFLDAAADDLRALSATNKIVAIEVFRLLKQLDAGDVQPRPLQDFMKTGDLSDCGKLVVAVDGQPEHRIVVRRIGDHYEVAEVIAIQDRTEDLPYLVAGLRLGRLSNPVRRSDALRRVARVRKTLGLD